MRKFFTFAFALFATVAMNAQEVDTSNWNEGDDIASYLNWGDYDGSWSGQKTSNKNGDYSIDDMGDYWKGSKPSEWNDVDGTAAVSISMEKPKDLLPIFIRLSISLQVTTPSRCRHCIVKELLLTTSPTISTKLLRRTHGSMLMC